MKKYTAFIIGIMFGVILVSHSAFSQSTVDPASGNLNTEWLSEQLKVFPNPSDGRFQLKLKYDGQEKVSAKVFDITGKLVKDITADLVIGKETVTSEVDLQAPGTGIYFLRIDIGKGTVTKKILVR
ncbi:MAG: T9SS type A sorting domain-containing protein [Bacteroidales bacterium]|nr:T9SS type A sorting domain-containing protein [Bacteroidales bacterium]